MSSDALYRFVERRHLPVELGGQLVYNHAASMHFHQVIHLIYHHLSFCIGVARGGGCMQWVHLHPSRAVKKIFFRRNLQGK